MVVFCSGYYCGTDSAVGLSNRQEILEQVEVTSQERGKSVGDRLSPTEIGGSGWQNTGNSIKRLIAMSPDKFFPPRPTAHAFGASLVQVRRKFGAS